MRRFRRQTPGSAEPVTSSADARAELPNLAGCGKSTTARLVFRLMEPPAGTVRFDGQDPSADTEIDTEALRKKRQIVVQDPYASMNARMTVRQIIAEPMTVQGVPTDEANAVSMIS